MTSAPLYEPQWLPIESAPRDGTAILIFEPAGHYGNLTSSQMPDSFEGGFYFSNDPRLIHYDDLRFAIGYWTPRGRWGNRNCADVNPTHWMPLPSPPPTPPRK